jgi:gliding motility-associated-like protein
MRKVFIVMVFLLTAILSVKATHNRAGEITFRQTGTYEYEFTVTTFTYAYSVVEQEGGRTSLQVDWGDNSTSEVSRLPNTEGRILLPENITYYRNKYKATHTFPGPGVYIIVMADPNSKNIPNSVNVVFSIKTTLIVNPQIGYNSTPVLLNNPIDKAAVGRRFVHNPAAYDPDGDSLSYKLTVCNQDKGQPIPNYTYPPASKELYVNALSGDLVWDAPVDTGIYNIAMNVEEWRKGVKIGNIERDMQVEVHKSDNHPPKIPDLPKLCVEAGKLINLAFTTTDEDNDLMKDTLTGGPFVVATHPAKFSKVDAGPGFTTMRFTWQTDVNHPRKQPYVVVVKSVDNYAKLNLVDMKEFSVYVKAPAPENLVTMPSNNSISLTWSKSVCPGAIGYEIYRTTSPTPLVVDTCSEGIPEGTTYTKIATTNSRLDTTYLDNNKGLSLSLGINYCYRVVAVFADGLKSHPSEESCTMLAPGTPPLTSASVTKVDDSGEVFVSWVKPHALDTMKAAAPGPYVYLIYRSNDLTGNNFSLIDTILTIDLSDTTYTDQGLNTKQYPYDYKVELYNATPGNRFRIGVSEMASTMYPDLYPSDNKITIKFAKNIPWINHTYIIYKQNPQSLAFDSIGDTHLEEYTDKNLANGTKYTYRVKAYGTRDLDNVIYNTLNWSHIASAIPIDTTRPCAPVLTVASVCDSMINKLQWTNPNHTCADDVVKYIVYFKNTLAGTLEPIATIDNVNDTTFRHTLTESLAGCYAVAAVDSFDNKSLLTNEVCIDSCRGYTLPNVFTPNEDGTNDVYVSTNPGNLVKKVDMKIFNRWGNLIFKTSDPGINWDGKEMSSKKLVSPGVYYYFCDVYEPRLTGTTVSNMVGFIHIFYSGSEKPLAK